MKSVKVSIVTMLYFLPSLVFAYPRFGALTGEKCSSCHFQASGGGIRAERGNLFAGENLMMKTFQSDDYEFDPQLKEGIRIGGDLRTMLTYNSKSESSDLIQMEGAMYGQFDLSKSIKIYLTLSYIGASKSYYFDAYGPNNSTFSEVPGATFGNSELYGKFTPGMGTFFKAGYFIPDFGLKTPDHRAFTRSNLNVGNYGYYVGFEGGIEQTDWSMSLYLGNQNSGYAEYGSKTKMGIVTGKYYFNLEQVKLMIGSSFMSKPNYSATSVFGHLGLFDLVTYIDEVQFLNDKTAGVKQNGLAYMGELSVIIIEGLHARVQYDYLNKDTSASNNQTRYTLGLPVYFATGFELEPMYQTGKDFGTNYTTYLLMTHFYF